MSNSTPSRPTIIVVGAGHAGLEASFAAARVGGGAVDVVVVTGRLDTVGQTPCNPSVGGVAKGHLVMEIEAMGGFMGRAADATAIHGKRLNLSKGPAVRATRVQVDKPRYGAVAQAALASYPGVRSVEGLVGGLVVEAGRAVGVRLSDGSELRADAVVVTTGTFLGGTLHTGYAATPGGRVGEAPATALSEHLRALGFDLKRLKTGTPPRLSGRTIDWDRVSPQPSDDPFPRFTAPDEPDQPGRLPEVTCHLTYTNPRTHAIVEAHLDESAMYAGRIEAVGARYCPSVEDKVVRFAGRERHHVFLEPEGLETDLVYPNGISTSLSAETQQRMVNSIEGLERAEIVQPGYAVAYDAVDARALRHTLGSKDVAGLYFAGQINGTSGYEEAGAQGLVAGANAALNVLGRAPLSIGRDQGYAGVMVDDLVTQGCDEPYRMFTSRAEFRIVLREDNADERLSELAFAAGLIDQARIDRVRRRVALVDACGDALARVSKRTRAGASDSPDPVDLLDVVPEAEPWHHERAQIRAVYAGYIDRQRAEIERVRGEGLPLPADLDYGSLSGLTREAAERLARVRPASTAQASRIAGITPAAVACLWAHARAHQRRAAKP